MQVLDGVPEELDLKSPPGTAHVHFLRPTHLFSGLILTKQCFLIQLYLQATLFVPQVLPIQLKYRWMNQPMFQYLLLFSVVQKK